MAGAKYNKKSRSNFKDENNKEETTCCQCQLPELHDKVFQTVYAAGLALLKIRKISSDLIWTSQLDIVIQGLDEAITDLRHSIKAIPRKQGFFQTDSNSHQHRTNVPEELSCSPALFGTKVECKRD